MLLVVALLARVTKICNVCDFLLLGMQRYVPMTNLEVEKLIGSNLDASKKTLTKSAKLTAAPRKSQKKMNQAKAAQTKEQAAKDGDCSTKQMVKLETERVRRGDLSDQQYFAELVRY